MIKSTRPHHDAVVELREEKQVTIRLDIEVLDQFRVSGNG